MHNLTKYLGCNRLAVETLNVIFTDDTVSCFWWLADVFVLETVHPAFTLAHSPGNINAHKRNAYQCESSVNRQAGQMYQVKHCLVLCFCHEVSIFLIKRHSQRILAGKVPSKCCFMQRAVLQV